MSKLHVNDITICYEITGQGDPLLFIHGLGSSLHDWELQVPVFARQYKVITLDLRGHGKSDKPAGPYSVRQFTGDTVELMKVLGLGPTHIVGISLGGMVAFQLSIDAPELVRSLTIVNSYPDVVMRTFGARLWFWQRLVLIGLFGMERLAQFMSRRLFPGPEQELLRKESVKRFAASDKQGYLNALLGIPGWSIVDKLGTITCPMLIVCGDRDYVPVSAKKEYAAKIPYSELVVISDSGHATPIDQPKKFNRVLLDFLAKH